MEIIIPSQELNFDLKSGIRSSPSTPKRYYFSAPTSPSHLSQFYHDFFTAGNDNGGRPASAVPFDWEEKPGTPKSPPAIRIENAEDFAFDVSQDWETASLSAEELFHGGVIKPLAPPPRLQIPHSPARVSESSTSPRKPLSQTRKMIQGAFSPRRRKISEETDDPFAVAARNASKAAAPLERGRERGGDLPKSSSRRAARSLSPLRDTQYYPWGAEETEQSQHKPKNPSPSMNSVCSAVSVASSAKGEKKWRLKDLFLFRSASEGRAADKDPLKKYTAALRRREMESTGSGSRRRGPVSAHEMHYNVNRAVSEDLKKKTFLPYKQGILGRLAFNPNGFGFYRK